MSWPVAVSLVKEARPRQWTKNVLVFAAPGAAGVLSDAASLAQTFGAFGCFCLAASGTYYLNDAADVEADRLHPLKRMRPIAAGEIPVGTATVIGVLAVLSSIALALVVTWQLAIVVAAYVTLTSAYSSWMKHVAVLDVVGVAAGFVLRAIAGAAATGVPVSNWFLIVASFGSLLMVVGKRRAEFEALGDAAAEFRPTLGLYPRAYLIQLQAISVSVVLVAYCLWAFEKAGSVQSPSGSSIVLPLFQISIVPFSTAVLRYLLLLETGHGGAPEEVVFQDRALQVMIAIWAAVFALGVYW